VVTKSLYTTCTKTDFSFQRIKVRLKILQPNYFVLGFVLCSYTDSLQRNVKKTYTGFWWGNLRERDHLGDPGVDERIISRWIFRNWDERA
jgi:hypothetical protein